MKLLFVNFFAVLVVLLCSNITAQNYGYYQDSYQNQHQGGNPFAPEDGPEPEFRSVTDFIKKILYGILHVLYPMLPSGILKVFNMGYVE